MTPDPSDSRYSRHIRIPEIGLQGQRLITESRIAVVGAGGLGSPVLMYLAAAGVGTIGVIDSDQVDRTNLQRQIIFDESTIGMSKAQYAAQRVHELNSDCDVRVFDVYLTSDNALGILSDFDIVIDATDNFATRYLINDSCVLLGIPYVWGSILRFDGQISVFADVNGPCYRCLFPHPPAPGSVPSCADAGVIGSVCGVIGSLQATAALMLAMNKSTPLVGAIGVFNAVDMSLQHVPVQRNPACPMCGTDPVITGLIDYALWCSASDLSIPLRELEQLLQERENKQSHFALVDIRERAEVDAGTIPGSLHLPMSELAGQERSQLVDHVTSVCGTGDIIFYCKSGDRSAALLRALTESGMSGIRHYPGGYSEWSGTRR